MLEEADFLRLINLSTVPTTLFLPTDDALQPVLDAEGGALGLGSTVVQGLMSNHGSVGEAHFTFLLKEGDLIETALGISELQCADDEGQLIWTGEGVAGEASSA